MSSSSSAMPQWWRMGEEEQDDAPRVKRGWLAGAVQQRGGAESPAAYRQTGEHAVLCCKRHRRQHRLTRRFYRRRHASAKAAFYSSNGTELNAPLWEAEKGVLVSRFVLQAFSNSCCCCAAWLLCDKRPQAKQGAGRWGWGFGRLMNINFCQVQCCRCCIVNDC